MTVKFVIASELLTFTAESVTLIVQFEEVPLSKVLKVMVLLPGIAEALLEEQEPP